MSEKEKEGNEIVFKRNKNGELEGWKNGKKIGTIHDMGVTKDQRDKARKER